jgi:acyl-coenzyme A synthetase/AMP-(fatty) acid ligase
VIELVRRAAAEDAGRVAVITPDGTTTYGEVLAGAERFAQALRIEGIDRFALLEADPAQVLMALAGAAAVGSEPCVYPLAATDEAVAEHRDRFGHEHLVTSRASLVDSGGRSTAHLTGPATVDPHLPPPPSSRPLMVMTTGTTGVPKGVRHEWDRLLRPTERLRATPEARWLLAYGLNQFGGLQVLIHVMAAQAVLVSSGVITPRAGLEAIRRHAVTHVSATPTYWRFLLAELRASGEPAPVLQQATLSGEAVPADVLEQVRAAFPAARVTQIYAATEFGQGISVRDGDAGLPLDLEADDSLELKVENGELFVRSKAAMLGYYGNEPVARDEWFATGDLVEVVDGRIEFRGRGSEVINVGGVKVHPLPVEQRLNTVPGVRAARVFGRTNALVGAIVAVELVCEPGADPEEVERLVREECADLPPASRPRSIRFVETLTTTGNKVVRGQEQGAPA